MRRNTLTLILAALLIGTGGTIWAGLLSGLGEVAAQNRPNETVVGSRLPPQTFFELQVLVDGRPVSEYFARNRWYIEAIKGAEYELRVRNPTPERVAVALSVDGLNTIDARHTSAWDSSKWVIEPYQTITISGWQMSTERARRFYFTDEKDSYGAKLGRTENLGVISAVIFREKRPMISVMPRSRQSRDDRDKSVEESAPTAGASSDQLSRKSQVMGTADDEYAATGIGRSVRNDVRWVDMQLESNPLSQISIRYEYYSALLRLGVVPRPNYEPYPVRRREDARGFSPEP